jgi:hypothetical protein
MRVVLKHAPGRSIRSVAVLALLALAPGAIALSSDGSPAEEPAEFRAYDASSAGAPPPSPILGLTDSMPLATHADKPEESLCDRAEEGHRRATTRGNELMKRGGVAIGGGVLLGGAAAQTRFPDGALRAR